jgi:hypothetical protein
MQYIKYMMNNREYRLVLTVYKHLCINPVAKYSTTLNKQP